MKNEQPNPALTFMVAKDLLRVYTHIKTYHGAWKRIRAIKDSLGKQPHQRLTIAEFAEWEGVDAQHIIQQLAS